jgi:TRAP-type C4-dicarboxylate transport system permease small subunit
MQANPFRKLKHGLIRFEKWTASLSLLVLLIFSLTQIIARNFFDTGFAHLDMITRHLVLLLAFMGAALISEQNGHIKIDILATLLTSRQKEKLARPLLLLSAMVCAVFSWYAIQFWIDEWHYASQHERWQVVFALVLPVGFTTLCLHLVLLVLTDFEHDVTSIDS